MRILLLSQYFWPENFIVSDLVKQLVQRGNEVCVLTGWPSYPDRSRFTEFERNRPVDERFEGAAVVRVGLLSRGKSGVSLVLNYLSFALSASFFGPWKLRGQRFDVVFVFQPSPLTVMLPAGILRRVFRAPVALWVLDLWPETLVAMGILKGRAPVRIGHWLARVAFGQADYVLAQSRRMMSLLGGRVRKGVPVGYLPNWTVEETRTDVSDAAPAWKDGRFSIVFAGNMGDAQDLPSILEAMALASKDLHWVFVGDGIRSVWFAEQVQRLGLTGVVTLVGRVPPSAVRAHLSAADALLITLKSDDVFSMTVPARLQTYLSVGRPIVGMIDGEAADIVHEAGAGICAGAERPQDLAEAVNALIQLPIGERDRMGRSAQAFEQAVFNREARAEQVEAVLSGLLSKQV